MAIRNEARSCDAFVRLKAAYDDRKAVLSAWKGSGKKVVCIVSGGNIDVTILNRVIKRGLIMSGRQQTLCIELPDKPGQLLGVSKIIAEHGANVISVHHERAGEGTDVTAAYLRIIIESYFITTKFFCFSI